MILVTAAGRMHNARSRLQYVIEDVIRRKLNFLTHPGLSVLQLVDSEQDLVDDDMYPRLLRTTRTSVGRTRKGVDFQ